MARLLSRATITLMYRLLSVGIAMFASTAYVLESQAGIVTFGTGANQFQMEFVTIGNPGNAADTTGKPTPAGAVGYTYDIGKFEVSRDMITKYNAEFGTSNKLIIPLGRLSSGYNKPNKPATGVSWNNAARFINWLNTSTGGFAAYKFTTGGVNDNIALWTAADTLDYDSANPLRSKRATYVLPSMNEWYKAAYYNPSDSNYYDFPNGSNIAPIRITSGTAAGTAVYNTNGPADVTLAGGLSPYGVMGMGGNVLEWEETSFLLDEISNVAADKANRGGCWAWTSIELSSLKRYKGQPSGRNEYIIGLRVARLTSPSTPPPPPPAVPEPSSLVIGTLFGLGGLLAKRRMKR